MTAFPITDAIQVAAAIVVGAALVQVVLLLISSFRRLAYEQEQRRLSIEFLRRGAETAMAQSREERDRVELSWNGFRKFEIQRKVGETKDVYSFYLAPHDGKPLPPYQPGQYLTFQLKIPDQAKPVVRCYSLSDSPNHPDHYRVSIKKVPPPRDQPDAPPGLSSSYFYDQVQEGDILDVKAPNGRFYLDMSKDTPVVLIGGGIGLTPVLSMLNAICESGAKRETWFFLGVRNRAEHLMKEHLERLDRENENVRLHVCYSNPGEGDRAGLDYHHAERVSADLLQQLLPSNNFDFYVCGPPPMMDSLTHDLKAWGVPDSRFHFEAFGPATVKKTPSAEAKVAEAAGKEIRVTFAKSGKTCAWQPDAGSLLELAEANGVTIDFGCRAGNCGTCITAVKAGDVDYMGDPGGAREDGSCLTCIAVPKSDLTLDA